MIHSLLVVCGCAAVGFGTWRGYVNARDALLPVVEQGDPTRAALEAQRPVVARARVRRFVRGALTAVAWLAVAMYGLLLVATGIAS